jgi:hypothetical protein
METISVQVEQSSDHYTNEHKSTCKCGEERNHEPDVKKGLTDLIELDTEARREDLECYHRVRLGQRYGGIKTCGRQRTMR